MAHSPRPTSSDRELAAIGAILNALDGLDGESIQRVLDYVFSRLSLGRPAHFTAPTSLPVSAAMSSQGVVPAHHVRYPSIRDLKEEKEPESANQMAALVAYYLSEIAPEGDRKDSINAADLEKYFKQAAFKLPKALQQALPNATAAGYLDSTGNGYYKLNPVGYNLVVHGLPRSASAGKPPTRANGKGKGKRR